MKKLITMFVAGLLIQQISQAQGTIYLSNLGQTPSGSDPVGSNSWLAARFQTGGNANGYLLDFVQLAMADASDTPSDFTAMIYNNGAYPGGFSPGSNLDTLAGSLSPASAGTYTYTPVSTLTLAPSTTYFIVLTAGTAVANGAYDWSYANVNSYNPSGGWFSLGGVWTSSNGSFWSPTAGNPQFALTASPIPEPGALGLLGLGGLGFLWHRRKLR